MSVRKQTMKYTAAAVAVAAVIIVSSTLYLGVNFGTPTTTGASGAQGGTSAQLAIQLTDPPTVPKGTTSLNLTYTSIGLLVGKPASSGQQVITTVSMTPQGGKATIDLLSLQNISQTIALAKLPNASTIYSFTLNVSSIEIDVNGTTSAVTLATGGSTLTVTLARPTPLSGNRVALLQLNPVIVSTSTGYQMIPSSVGIIAAGTSNGNEDQIGFRQHIDSQDQSQLQHAQGNLSAKLSALSVNQNVTTISVQVNNTGSISVVLGAIGVQGNFTATGLSCTQNNGNSNSGPSQDGGSSDSSNSTTQSTTTQSHSSNGNANSVSQSRDSRQGNGCEFERPDQLVFVPVNSTVSGTGCVALKMQLVSGDSGENGPHGLTLSAGQCVVLTFVGKISLGQSGAVLVPSVLSGQVYAVHVIASQGADAQLSCALPVAPTSCSVLHTSED